MYSDNSSLPLPRSGKGLYIPVMVCAGFCIVLLRVGLFSFFFLVPLGFCAVRYGSLAAWLGFIFAVLGNAVVSIGFSLGYGLSLANAFVEILYFSLLALGFIWIMAGNPPYPMPALPKVRTLFRIIAASLAGALIFLGMLYRLGNDERFYSMALSQIEAISSGIIASSGGDAVQQTAIERLFTPDRILTALSSIIFRGGALFSMFLLFFISRQASFLLARLFGRRENPKGDLLGFYAPQKSIWVFSMCLPVIVICRVISMAPVEIAAWNLLVICVIMFLAQGGGIVLYYLARRPMPASLRLLTVVLILFLVFSPGINILALGVLVFLGIAENWLPLRKPAVSKEDF
jgi:hypothetical protein